MKVNLVSVKTAVREFIRNTGHQGELDKSDIIAWANDASSRVITEEQYTHKITLLEVKDYKVLLPHDFKYIIQAGYLIDDSRNCKKLREEVIQFKDKQWGCNLEINLVCPKCHKQDCNTCEAPTIIVDADRTWRDSHPEHAAAYMKHFYDYGHPFDSEYRSTYHQDFRLMRPNTGSFNNIDFHIKNCINLNLDCEINYTIDLPNIVVNFKEGKILLAYMARPIDEEGYLMIPDVPVVHEAIGWYVQTKMAYRTFCMDPSQNNRILWTTAVEMSEKMISRARSEMNTPTYEEWSSWHKKFIHRIIPRYDFEQDQYRGSTSRYNFKYPNETYNSRNNG